MPPFHNDEVQAMSRSSSFRSSSSHDDDAAAVAATATATATATAAAEGKPASSSDDLLLELIREECWDEIFEWINHSDYGAKEPGILRRVNLYSRYTVAYPLHFLCKNRRAPPSLVGAFLDEAPLAASHPDRYFRNLPLHVACRHDAPVETIRILSEAHPMAVDVRDEEGNWPLHLACMLGSYESVRLLVELDPSIVNRRNDKGQYPLHLACNRFDASLETISLLLSKDDVGTAPRSQDRQGRLPLHSALMWRVDEDVLRALLESYPQAVRVTDRQNLTPYGVCRNRALLSSSDPRVRLLRTYRLKCGKAFLRGRDAIQFSLESAREAVKHRHHRRRHRCRATRRRPVGE